MEEREKYQCLEQLGAAMRQARLAKGLYQADVARMVSISQGHYSMIENGKQDAEFVTIAKICKLLDVDLNSLIMQCI